MSKNLIDTPLKCEIEGDELVIRIGINTLKHAAEYCPKFYDYEKCFDPPFCRIIDANELAKDVRQELFREEEDGSSPIGDLLDECFNSAFEDGSLAFAEND
jgi:hypothetical protein